MCHCYKKVFISFQNKDILLFQSYFYVWIFPDYLLRYYQNPQTAYCELKWTASIQFWSHHFNCRNLWLMPLKHRLFLLRTRPRQTLVGTKFLQSLSARQRLRIPECRRKRKGEEWSQTSETSPATESHPDPQLGPAKNWRISDGFCISTAKGKPSGKPEEPILFPLPRILRTYKCSRASVVITEGRSAREIEDSPGLAQEEGPGERAHRKGSDVWRISCSLRRTKNANKKWRDLQQNGTPCDSHGSRMKGPNWRPKSCTKSNDRCPPCVTSRYSKTDWRKSEKPWTGEFYPSDHLLEPQLTKTLAKCWEEFMVTHMTS